MAAPGWLTTDPEPVRLPKRIRPGWAPRPNKKVALVHGWAKPEEFGAGQGLVSGAEGSWEDPWAPPTPGPPAAPTPQPEVEEPTPNLTPSPEPDILSPEAGTSVPPQAAPPSLRGVLSGGSAGSTAARAGVTSGAKAPPPQGPPSAPSPTGTSKSTNPFVQQNIAAAKRVSAKTGVPWQVLLAIPGNETGWGKAVAGNNYFGIKGSNPKTGANTGSVGTWEVVNGQRVNINDTFRAYTGYEESAEDFAQFLKDNPRYAKALKHLESQPDDWRGFVRKVHDAGYATDPEWSNKVIRIGDGIGNDDGGPTPGAPGSRVSQARAVLKSDPKGRRGVQSVIDVGMTAIGTKYQWGGAGGRSSFEEKMAPTDCSGFVAWAYQRATGHKLPAYTGSIWDTTRGISADDAAPGDLVMYNMGKGATQQHVGIYLGNGQMLHDSSVNPNGGVDITPLWGNPSFRRVEGIDPAQSSYGGTDSLTRVRSRMRTARATRETLRPEEWTKFVPERAFVPDQPEMGAGQDTATLEETEEERRRREEAERLDREKAEQDRLAIEEGQRRQAEAEALAQTPEWWSEYQGKSYPLSDTLAGTVPNLERDTRRLREQLGGEMGALGEGIGGALGALGGAAGRLGGATERLRREVGEEVGGALDVLGGAASTAGGNIEQETRRLRGEAGEEIGGGFGALGAAANQPVQDTERLRGEVGAELGAVGEAVTPVPGELPAPGLETPPSRLNPQPQPAEQAAPTAPPPSRFTPPPVTEPDPNAPPVDPLKAFGELTGGPSETYPSGGPLAGPITGGLREVEGGEQLVREFEQQIGMPYAEFERLVNEDLERVRSGAQAEPNPDLTRLRELQNEMINQAGRIPAYARAPAEEQAKTEITGGVVTALASTALLPGNIAATPGGIARAGAALALDPAAIPFQGATEAVRAAAAAARTLRAADEANKTATAAVKAAQSAQLAATPEGRETVEALALAADPRTVAHGGGGTTSAQVRKGGALLNQVQVDAAGEAARRGAEVESLVDEATKLSRVEQASFDTRVAEAARTPLTAQDEVNILQQASLDLRGEQARALEASAAQMARAMSEGGHMETLTGAQMRRHLLNQMGQHYVSLATHVLPEQLLDDVDEILARAGREDLTHRAAIQAGAAAPDDVLKASNAWYGTDLAREADKIFAARARATESGIEVAGGIPPAWARGAARYAPHAAGRGAAGLAAGLPGYAAGVAAEEHDADPNDDSYPPWRIIGGLTGFGLGAIGMPYVGAFVSKHWTAPTIRSLTEVLAPVENLSPEARRIYGEWAGDINMARQLGDNLADRITHTWRTPVEELANNATARYVEVTGNLPPKLRGNVDAEETLEYWKRIAEWARHYGIIEEPILASRARVYMPHVLDADWKQAKINAHDIRLGPAYETKATTTRQVNANPFWYYSQPRVHDLMNEGIAAGVTYTDDVAGALGSYYQRAIETAAHRALAEKLVQLAAKNDPSIMTRARASGLSGSDVIRLDPKEKARIKNGKRVTDLLGFNHAGLEDVMVSGEMHSAMHELLGDKKRLALMEGIFGSLFKANSLLRQSVLSGVDIYQLWHTSNALFASRSGLAGLHPGKWIDQQDKAIEDVVQGFQFMLQPHAYRQFINHPVTMQRQSRALRDGLNLTLSIDRPDQLGWKMRWGAAALNMTVGGIAGYQGTLAAGGSEEEAIRNMAIAAGLGTVTGAPVFGNRFKGGPGLKLGQSAGVGFGKQQVSLIQAVSDGTWDRFIPYLKLQVYEAYRGAGQDGRAAAEFANEIFGGQNILAIARSRNVQDALRVALMTPDWQEGFARSIGNAAFNWGKDKPLGHMNRVYWANVLVGGAVGLELLNHAFGGNWSWQNDPDKVLSVKMTKLYDKFGWNRTDHNGQQYDPYWDWLGPFRSLMEPMAETAKWGLAAGYNSLGVEADDLPLSNEIRGKWPGIPKADPAKAWGNFLRARQGWLVAAASEVAAGKDFAGRPLDREEDPIYQQAVNRIWAVMQSTLPAGLSDVTRGLAKGENPAAVAYQYMTGHRVERETRSTRQAAAFDEWLKEAHRTSEDWRKMRDEARKKGYEIDKDIELTISGLVNSNNKPAKPGESDMTARERSEHIESISSQRRSVFQQRYDLLADMPEGPDKDRLRGQLQELQKYHVVGGGPVPSDLRDQSDLDMDEIIRQAWNRDPKEIARLQGKAPFPTDPLEMLKQGVRTVAERMEPGYDEKLALAEMRNRWMVEIADKHNIDLAVLQDLIKAEVYQVTDANGEHNPPVLDGVTSQQLDEIGDLWRAKAFDEDDKPRRDFQAVSRERQTLVMQHAQALGVDPEALTQRLKLRNMPLMDATPAAISRSHALDVLNTASFFEYLDENGNPMGNPEDWADFDKLLEANKNRFEYQESHGMGFFVGRGGETDPDLTKLQRARERARATRHKDIINSQHAEDYYRWFGDGANMTDKQWTEYRAGTLDMWWDKPSPAEAQRRTEAMRVWAALTPDERNKYGIPEYGGTPVGWDALNEFGRMAKREGSLAGYMQYINTYRTKKYLLDEHGKEQKDANGNPISLLGEIDPAPATPLS